MAAPCRPPGVGAKGPAPVRDHEGSCQGGVLGLTGGNGAPQTSEGLGRGAEDGEQGVPTPSCQEPGPEQDEFQPEPGLDSSFT